MKRADFLLLVAVLVLTLSVRAWASPADLLRDDGVVFDQQPTRYGGPLADTLALDEFGFERWQRVADNVRLAEAATIRRISWFGFYGGDDEYSDNDPPEGDETMRVRFYAARPDDGLPGEVLLEQSFLNLPRTFTGHVIGVGMLPREYLFEADLSTPILLSANTLYWLEVVQLGDVGSIFRWEEGAGRVSGCAFINDYTPSWTFVWDGLAFELSTVPEPTNIVVLTCGGLLARSWLGGRRSRGLRQNGPL
ncbi:MAG TPA: hypothetical protein VMV94_19955 [Phycisphaerae bacterium]|nr:hypothetical protein [Phycisphaerae bacterium]